MTKPQILTAAFWTRRVDAVTESLPRMFRTGAQFVIGAIGASDATPIDAFDVDWKLFVGSFAGGCVVWLITTVATPPRT